MPTYEYACTDCGDKSEVVQRFSDDPLTICTECGGKLRKVFSPVGIVFKGSGFYRNDSRNGSSAAAKDGAGTGSNGSSSAESSGASSSSDAAKKDSSGSESSAGKTGGSAAKSDSSGSEKKSSVAAAS